MVSWTILLYFHFQYLNEKASYVMRKHCSTYIVTKFRRILSLLICSFWLGDTLWYVPVNFCRHAFPAAGFLLSTGHLLLQRLSLSQESLKPHSSSASPSLGCSVSQKCHWWTSASQSPVWLLKSWVPGSHLSPVDSESVMYEAQESVH